MTLEDLIAALTGRDDRPYKQGPTGEYLPPETYNLPGAPNTLMEAVARAQQNPAGPALPPNSPLASVQGAMQNEASTYQAAQAANTRLREALARGIADEHASQAQNQERLQRVQGVSGVGDMPASGAQPTPAPLPPPAPPPVLRPAPTQIAQAPAPRPQPQVPMVDPRADTRAMATAPAPLVTANLNQAPPQTGGRMPAAPLNARGQVIFNDRFQTMPPEEPFPGMGNQRFTPFTNVTGTRPPPASRPAIQTQAAPTQVIGAGYGGQPINAQTPAPAAQGGPVVPANRFPVSNEGRPGFSADELNRAELARFNAQPSNVMPANASANGAQPGPMRTPAPPPLPPDLPPGTVQQPAVPAQMGTEMPPHLREQLLDFARRQTANGRSGTLNAR